MEQVLDIYKRPYNPLRPVVCMDETPYQMIGHVREPQKAAPGKIARYDYEYFRSGVCNIFTAVEPLTGKRILEVTERRTKEDWAKFIEKIACAYEHAEKITLVMDNLNTHTAGALYLAFKPELAKSLRDRFEFAYTPKHGSWLNIAEIEISVLKRQCLSRRMESIEVVHREIDAWVEKRNAMDVLIDWQFTTSDARVKLKSLYPTLGP